MKSQMFCLVLVVSLSLLDMNAMACNQNPSQQLITEFAEETELELYILQLYQNPPSFENDASIDKHIKSITNDFTSNRKLSIGNAIFPLLEPEPTWQLFVRYLGTLIYLCEVFGPKEEYASFSDRMDAHLRYAKVISVHVASPPAAEPTSRSTRMDAHLMVSKDLAVGFDAHALMRLYALSSAYVTKLEVPLEPISRFLAAFSERHSNLHKAMKDEAKLIGKKRVPRSRGEKSP